MQGRPAVTTFLGAMARGDAGAQEKLYALAYDELKRIARSAIRKSAGPLTFNPSTLVHEAYLKLSADAGRVLNDSNHFYSLLARAMRQVILDAGRAQSTVKHGEGMRRVDLSETLPEQELPLENLLSVDHALGQLETVDPELAQLVELHFFAGLRFVDIARLRGANERTIRRHWETARAFLLEHMQGSS